MTKGQNKPLVKCHQWKTCPSITQKLSSSSVLSSLSKGLVLRSLHLNTLAKPPVWMGTLTSDDLVLIYSPIYIFYICVCACVYIYIYMRICMRVYKISHVFILGEYPLQNKCLQKNSLGHCNTHCVTHWGFDPCSQLAYHWGPPVFLSCYRICSEAKRRTT